MIKRTKGILLDFEGVPVRERGEAAFIKNLLQYLSMLCRYWRSSIGHKVPLSSRERSMLAKRQKNKKKKKKRQK
jgi:hypothetical protein